MAEFRGRHFGFLGLLCAAWVTARIGFLTFAPNAAADVSDVQNRTPPSVLAQSAWDTAMPAITIPPEPYCCVAGPAYTPSLQLDRPSSPSPTQPFMVVRRLPKAASAVPSLQPVTANKSLAIEPALILQLPAQPPLPGHRAQFYAYSFWRNGGQAGALNSGTQYGGSQSGFVATYALHRFETKDREERLALLLRGAIAHDNLREREVAVGLRWRPSQRVPLSVNAERRFRNDRSDAFAAYVAGGFSQVRLPMQFSLEGFGQAGIVSGKNAGPFFDFLARADRQVVELGSAIISAGAGTWGGGQDNVHRVDIGPSVRTDVALGEANFRLSADWRFRVAGDAKPGNGPAITLSTSF